MNRRSRWWSMGLLLGAVLGWGGCATSRPGNGSVHTAVWESEVYQELQAVKGAMAAAADRERALAQRLVRLETAHGLLAEELQNLREQAAGLQAAIDSLPGPIVEEATWQSDDPSLSQSIDVNAVYRAALESYQNRQYQAALDQFAQILSVSPYSEWADNAQYWKGECYYALGKYHHALTEFTKVFAFEKTHKADDAQLKIARCHLALGEKDRALAAFEKLVNEYPESEYLPMARRQMKELQRP